MRKPVTTYEKCKEVSLKCKTQKEFKNKYPSEYRFAYKNNHMKDCCSHMKIVRRPNGYWTKEKCHDAALKCKNKTEFRDKYGSANFTAIKNGWIDDICSHMDILKHNGEYWIYEICKELALKCKSRTEFHGYYYAAHKVSLKNNWLDDICSHMKPTNKNKRCIYAYEFSDNHVYVGLTYNLKNRHNRHMKNYKDNSAVNNYMKLSNIEPKLIQLTDYLNIKEAKNKEKYFVEKYKNENWIILNTAKTGSIGGITMKWTKEECYKKALKCKTKTEFYKKYASASGSALKNGWIDEICSHMNEIYVKRGYWNDYNNCLNEAIKQKTRTNFRKYGSGAFKSAVKNNWIDKIYKDMKWL